MIQELEVAELRAMPQSEGDASRRLYHIFPPYIHHSVPFSRFLCEAAASDGRSRFCIGFQHEEDKARFSAIPEQHIIFYERFELLMDQIGREPDARFLFHSLFSFEQWLQVARLGILNRSSWVAWGADIYKTITPSPSGTPVKQRLKRVLLLWLKRFAVKRLRAVVALNFGDAEIIEDAFWAKRKVSVLRYPLDDATLTYPEQIEAFNTEDKSVCDVFCGNSADPTNNHVQLLDSLAHLKDGIRVHMPLNYGGSDDYVKQVCEHGERLFGELFVPLTEFIAKEDYNKLLSRMDAAVFFHERQQGLYVAFMMLLNGKPMYIRGSVSSHREFTQLGISVGESENIPDLDLKSFAELPIEVASRNAKIAREAFTEGALREDWSRFMSELLQ